MKRESAGWSHQVNVSRCAIAVSARKGGRHATIEQVPIRTQISYRCSDFGRFFSWVGVSGSAGRAEDRRIGAQRRRAHVI